MKTEPVITVSVITAFVAAVLAVLTAFGLPLSDDQQRAILGLIAVVAPIVAAVIGRRLVSPVSQTVAPPEHAQDAPPQ